MLDRHITLKDGRRLGFAEYGARDGTPLMLFHGTPGSRRMAFLQSAAWIDQYGLRVLAPERPGYGLSDPAPGRRIGDWADDVAQLADQLGLARFHVAGGSGGGPFALACALRRPDRVRSATLICSGCPPQAMHDRAGMNRGNRLVFFLAAHAPPLLRVLMSVYARSVTKPRPARSAKAARKLKHKMHAQLCAWDRRVLDAGEHDPGANRQLTKAFRQGPAGAWHDMMQVSRDWGLDLQTLAVPVFLWHGTADTLMPVSCARAFAAMLPACESHFIDGAGHMLLADADTAARMMQRLRSVAP